MTPVIGCNIDNDHRPLKPVLWPKGTVLHPRRALDFRGFCFSWSRFCVGAAWKDTYRVRPPAVHKPCDDKVGMAMRSSCQVETQFLAKMGNRQQKGNLPPTQSRFLTLRAG
jgi:hypothetical protein